MRFTIRLKLGLTFAGIVAISVGTAAVEVETDGIPTAVGRRVDKVYEITEVAASAPEEIPQIGRRWHPQFIRCIGKRGSDFSSHWSRNEYFPGLAARTTSLPPPPLHHA